MFGRDLEEMQNAPMTEVLELHNGASSDEVLGTRYLGSEQTAFRVWAPHADRVSVEIYHPSLRTVALQRSHSGHWSTVVEGVSPGALYKYRLGEDRVFPDPASQSQPEGVHGPSMVVSHDFQRTDGSWHGMPIEEYVLYELHIGTFTDEGTFEAAIEHLPYLKELGVTAIEVMPVAQFPGSRNWGYDGVYPYAVQNSYGGPVASNASSMRHTVLA
jgi:maltooligosyltrehalose trehalohydrolase